MSGKVGKFEVTDWATESRGGGLHVKRRSRRRMEAVGISPECPLPRSRGYPSPPEPSSIGYGCDSSYLVNRPAQN